MLKDQKSLGSGLLFIILGGGMILYSLRTLATGTALRMGPGYFPMMIGVCLLGLGALVILSAKGESRIDLPHWPWRQIIMVAAAILIFAIGLDRIGFLASALAMAFVTALARRETPIWQAAVIAVAITAFCTAVFYWGLGIPFQLY